MTTEPSTLLNTTDTLLNTMMNRQASVHVHRGDDRVLPEILSRNADAPRRHHLSPQSTYILKIHSILHGCKPQPEAPIETFNEH